MISFIIFAGLILSTSTLPLYINLSRTYNRFVYIKARYHKPSDLQCSTVDVSDKHGSLLVHGGHEDGALGPQHHPVHLEVHSLALDCEVGELSRLKQLRLYE